MIGNTQDAEDVAQESFVKLYQTWHSYDQNKSLKNWICTITLNTARDFYRKNKHMIHAQEFVEDHAAPDERAASAIDDALSGQKMLASLNANYRTVMILFYIQQLSIKEIAQIIKRPQVLVKVWLFRARKELDKRFGGQAS